MENLDKETQEILAEMAKDGEIDKDQLPNADVKPEDGDKGKAGEAANQDDSGQKANDDQGKDDQAEVNRPVHSMPLAKYNKQKEKWENDLSEKDKAIETLQQQIKDLSGNTNGSSNNANSAATEDEITAFAEANDLEPDVVKGIVEIARKSNANAMPPEVVQAVQELVAERQHNAKLAEHEQLFAKELEDLAKEYPNENITEAKAKLKELAFSEGTNNKSLYEIYFRHIKPNQTDRRKTVEASKGTADRDNMVDFDKIKDDPEAINKLSDEDFDRFSAYMGSKGKYSIVSR